MIVWLHGAYSTGEAFNYFRKTKWGPEFVVNYDCSGNLISATTNIKKSIEKITSEPVDLVGHSLGGVLAVALEQKGLKIRSIVTLASPFGGIGGFWPPKTIGYEIKKLTKNLQLAPSVKHQCYVSINGYNPWMIVPNDGVVPIASQKFLKDANYIEVEANHFEILMNDRVISNIRKFHSELQ